MTEIRKKGGIVSMPSRFLLFIFALVSIQYQNARADGRPGPIELTNVAETLPTKEWRWTSYISGEARALEQVRCVVYILHPTFSEPVRRVCKTENPLYPFAVTAVGWAPFTLVAKVEFKDGTSDELVHMLDFSGAQISILADQDLPGFDYKRLRVTTLIACQLECINDRTCKAYSFVPPYTSPYNFQGLKPQCFLKKGIPEPVQFRGVFSGRMAK